VRLPQLLVRAGHVEDVVDDLKQDAELVSEAPVGRHRRLVEPGEAERHHDARGDQAAGLQGMKLPQVVLARLARDGDVPVLAADHPGDPGRAHELRQGGEHVRRLALLNVGKDPHRLGEETVAREDRDVLAELDVRGRAAATEVVVVHRRQVVVDERVGVDQLDRSGGGQDPFRRDLGRARGGEDQHRADALAAGEQ
jgi:hypothetical protein